MRVRGELQSDSGKLLVDVDATRRVIIDIDSSEVELCGAWQEPCSMSVWRIRPRHWEISINDAALGRVRVTVAPLGPAEAEAARLFGGEPRGDYMYGIDCGGQP